jgi:hypothetical protein
MSKMIYISTLLIIAKAVLTYNSEYVNSSEHCNPFIEPRPGEYGAVHGHRRACYGPIVGYHDPPIALGSVKSLGGETPEATSTPTTAFLLLKNLMCLTKILFRTLLKTVLTVLKILRIHPKAQIKLPLKYTNSHLQISHHQEFPRQHQLNQAVHLKTFYKL